MGFGTFKTSARMIHDTLRVVPSLQLPKNGQALAAHAVQRSVVDRTVKRCTLESSRAINRVLRL